MTDFFDGVRTGQAGTASGDRLPDDIRTVQTSGLIPQAIQFGIHHYPFQFWNVVPGASSTTAITSTQTASGVGVALTLSAGPTVTTTTINNASYYALDVPRSLTVNGVTGTLTSTFTVNGLDQYFKTMTQTFTGPFGFTSVTTQKAFAYVAGTSGVTISGNAGTGAISVGTSDTLGAPYRMPSFEYGRFAYNSIGITSSAGFTAADGTTATALTGDTRGTYALPSAADGSKRMTCVIALNGTNNTASAFGVVQA